METLELQQILQSIPQDKQNLFLLEYNSNKKNPTTAVVLAVFLGGLGAHHFYLGNIGLGVLYLVFCWTGLTYLVGWVEAISLSEKVRKQNMMIARETAATLGGQISIDL